MANEAVIELKSPGDIFTSGAKLEGIARLYGDFKKAELSVMWITEGKGDTDRKVILFEDLDAINGGPDYSFSVTLPSMPCSYEGTLLKIIWLVRLRAFPVHGAEIISDRPFKVHNGRTE